MRPIYTFLILLYGLTIKLASFFNEKAKLWVSGRKNILENIENEINPNDKTILMHTASLGEFEQGRPLLEALRIKYPDYKLVLTFFSPSGYEIRKDYDQVDHVFYLPLDTPGNAKRFIKALQPQLAIFVKYEFWYNYLKELKDYGCKTIFISSIFRKDQHFFKWYGGWFRKQLKHIFYFFIQTEISADLLAEIGFNNVCISGDTRFDRVYDLAQQCDQYPIIEKFKQNKPLFIAGSTWPPDEDILLQYIEKNPEVKFIVASHDVKVERINQIQEKLGDIAIRFSEVKEDEVENYQVLIIDSIGELAHLYQYADLCYIGGGFGVAIHNIQEPVTFGKPVLFGPKFEKFREANDLIERGGCFNVNNTEELEITANRLLNDKETLTKASAICTKYVDEMRGATQSIMRFIETNLLK